MLMITDRWTAIIAHHIDVLNREAANVVKYGAGRTDVRVFSDMLDARNKVAAYTYHRDLLTQNSRNYTVGDPVLADITKSGLDRDIIHALSNPKMAQAYKDALVQMRRDCDMPVMWQKDPVSA